MSKTDKPAVEEITESTASSDLLARLDAAERELKSRDAKIEALQDEVKQLSQAGGLKYSPQEKPFAGENGGYEFIVTPHPKEGDTDFAHLKSMSVRCIDESEALRWYCQVNETKKGSGRALDPVKVRLTVACVGRERADSIVRQKQISVLRKKIESGMQLTDADNELLAQCEEQIYGFKGI